MISNQKVLCIIPARGGSKGLPKKNVMSLLGKPLVGWPIKAALGSEYIDRIIVSTEDPSIAEIAISQGAEVPFLRPAELASDTATSISVIEHAIEFTSSQNETYDYCVLLEPTSPTTESSDVDLAIDKLVQNRSIADAIVGVSRLEGTHPVFSVSISLDGIIHPYISQEQNNSIRRQDTEDLFFFDGSLYISDTSVFLQKRGFYHERTLGFVTPKWKSLEIDDMIDFVCVEAILKNRNIFTKPNE
jgi:N-acylneuraminate cytidylyltransferase/CMP-N,N'-diacetyllegionaminic acid synthase